MYKDKISIIIPVHNEEGNINPLLDELTAELFNNFIDFEIIVVDDGSKDNTKNELQNYNSEKLKTVFLEENVGQSAALFSGIKIAQNEIIVLMDGDMQYNPSDIPKLYRKLIKDVKLVSGIRSNRNDKWLYKNISLVGNSFIKLLFKHSISDIGCGLKITYKENLIKMTYFKNIHRYIGVIYCLNNLQVSELEISHRERFQGKSKYSIWKTFGVVKELVYIKLNHKHLKA